MPAGFRILPSPVRPSPALVAALAGLQASLLSDNMSRLQGAGASMLRPMHRGGTLAGPAFTVKVAPGDNLLVHKAIDLAAPGDVIVVDAGGHLEQAIIGEIMSSWAAKRGVAGFVIDGAVRDAAALAEGSFPVYARGASHRGPYKDGPGEINVPVTVDGMPVAPGDVVVGDGDGVVAFPRDAAPALIERARAQLAKEEDGVRAIAEGRWDRSWIAPLEKKLGLT